MSIIQVYNIVEVLSFSSVFQILVVGETLFVLFVFSFHAKRRVESAKIYIEPIQKDLSMTAVFYLPGGVRPSILAEGIFTLFYFITVASLYKNA